MAGAEEELYRKWKVKSYLNGELVEWNQKNSGIVRRDKRDCKRNLKIYARLKGVFAKNEREYRFNAIRTIPFRP